MRYHLRISGAHWKALRAHLFPGDELEAVAGGGSPPDVRRHARHPIV